VFDNAEVDGQSINSGGVWADVPMYDFFAPTTGNKHFHSKFN